MSSPGSLDQVIISALFLLLLIVHSLYSSINHFNLHRLFSAFVISLLCLVVFKASFIRYDAWHLVAIYLLQCFLLIYLLHVYRNLYIQNILITVCLLSLFCMGQKNEWYFFNGDQIRNAYTSIISKFNNIDRLFNIQQNAMDFRNSVASIRNTHALPTLKGTSDIYNFNQAVLLASDNKWNPRPAFQSYQSVTPYLAKANYDHLIDSSSAPDNIFFKLETIDSRYPSLDDGMSWKALLGLYKPIFWTAGRDYLVLTRDKGSRPLLVSDVQKINDAKMGEYIVNPYHVSFP